MLCRAARSVGDKPCLIYKRFAESAQIERLGLDAVFKQFLGQISIVKIGGFERDLEIRVSFQLAPLFVIMGSIPVPEVPNLFAILVPLLARNIEMPEKIVPELIFISDYVFPMGRICIRRSKKFAPVDSCCIKHIA